MSSCDVTLRLFLDGFLALTMTCKRDPVTLHPSGHSPTPALSCCQCFNLPGVGRESWAAFNANLRYESCFCRIRFHLRSNDTTFSMPAIRKSNSLSFHPVCHEAAPWKLALPPGACSLLLQYGSPWLSLQTHLELVLVLGLGLGLGIGLGMGLG